MQSSILVTIVASIQALAPTNGIVGGTEVSPKFKYPWMVSLQYYNRQSCGGTLYTNNAIITAAHCLEGETAQWTAHFHRHNLKETAAKEGGWFYPIKSRVNHPSYNSDSNAFDVAVWKIDAKTSNPYVALDNGNYANSEGTQLSVIGWGTTYFGGPFSNVLLEVKVPVTNIASCKKSYPKLDSRVAFCAGFAQGGKDSCQADSGGPIFIPTGNYFTLVGVVSTGVGCGQANTPGLYTRIGAVTDFINRNL